VLNTQKNSASKLEHHILFTAYRLQRCVF